MPSQILTPSPFSATELQKRPLFDRQKAAGKIGDMKIKVLPESPFSEGDLISAERAAGPPLKVASCADVKLSSQGSSPRHRSESPLLLGCSTAFPAHWQQDEEEEEEEEFGELGSCKSDVSQASAISIAPKASSGTLHICCDGPHLGFWADVGASTVDLDPVTEDSGFVKSDFSAWESESEDEEDNILLPWDY